MEEIGAEFCLMVQRAITEMLPLMHDHLIIQPLYEVQASPDGSFDF